MTLGLGGVAWVWVFVRMAQSREDLRLGEERLWPPEGTEKTPKSKQT